LNYFNYFSEIEQTFIRRRERNLLLSPLDWALIESWQERGVPLNIVLRGIEQVFDGVDKNPAKKRSVKSLLYCREEIESQYAAWLEMQTGKNGNTELANQKQAARENPVSADTELFSAEAIDEHLKKVSAELEAARTKAEGDLRETLEKIGKNLTEIRKKTFPAEKLEDALERLDAAIDESLLKTLENEKIKAEIKKEIASYQNRMEKEVYQRTFDLMLIKRLRETAEIPRLSLFYL